MIINGSSVEVYATTDQHIDHDVRSATCLQTLRFLFQIVAFMVMSIVVAVFAVYAFIACFLFGLGFIVVLSRDTSVSIGYF